MRPDLDVCVCNPLTEKFTSYEILIQTSNPAFTLHQSHTRRRYNDFCWLKKILKSHHPLCLCPELPEKKQSSERFEVQFLVQRMKKLEKWINEVIAVTLYLSDSALHLFLQTNLTCKQIDHYLKGKLLPSEIEEAYKAASFKEPGALVFPQSHSRDGRGDADDGSHSDPVPCPNNTSTGTVTIRQNEHSLLNDSQNRSDSGIAETESDFGSSYESRSSTFSSSFESSGISGSGSTKLYPPVTEVGQVARSPASLTVLNESNFARDDCTLYSSGEDQATCSGAGDRVSHMLCIPGTSRTAINSGEDGVVSAGSCEKSSPFGNAAGRKTPLKVENGVVFSVN